MFMILIRPIWDWKNSSDSSMNINLLDINQTNLGLKACKAVNTALNSKILIRPIWDWKVQNGNILASSTKY